jgi:hypothetical protein
MTEQQVLSLAVYLSIGSFYSLLIVGLVRIARR